MDFRRRMGGGLAAWGFVLGGFLVACHPGNTSNSSGSSSSGGGSPSSSSSSSTGGSSQGSSSSQGTSSSSSSAALDAGHAVGACGLRDGGLIPPPPGSRDADGNYLWEPRELTPDNPCAPAQATITGTLDPAVDDGGTAPVLPAQCAGCCAGASTVSCETTPDPNPPGARGRPTTPFLQPRLVPPNVSGPCAEGQGWDFEDGTYQGWTYTGIFSNSLPVFGNNVSVSRLKPPGMSAAAYSGALAEVGGDYWEFSRDVNQGNDYWLGSSDHRRNWTELPGARMPETSPGTLTSPTFVLSSDYLSFRLGGANHTTQRVELWVYPLDTADKNFLASDYEGLGTLSPGTPGPALTNVETPSGARLVRSSSPAEDSDWMGATVFWYVKQLRGRTAYLVVVDEVRSDCITPDPQNPSVCLVPAMQHINVDQLACTDALPAGARWETRCSFASCGASTRSARVVTPQPVWGTTEAHSHPLANKQFGGHLFWGDPTDTLKTVYNCVSDSVPQPFDHAPGSPRATNQQCRVRADMVLALGGTLALVCLATAVVPVVGWILASGCSLALTTAVAALLILPAFSGRTYHGADKFTAGGLTFLEWLGWMVGGLGVADISGVIEGLDWDTPGRHSGHGLTRMHQMYQFQMLQRAWNGGLRLLVADAENGRLLQYALDGRTDYSDWQALEDLVDGMQRLTDPVNGPARSFAEIALTPAQARDIISRDKLAIILGSEVEELGKLRFPGDTVEQQVADLYAMGIRKITPIHGINSPLGGASIFNDIYNVNNLFANSTLDPDGNTTMVSTPFGELPVWLPAVLPPPFSLALIGRHQMGQMVAERAPAGEPSSSHGTYFHVEDGNAETDWIGGGVTYRAGMEQIGKHMHSVAAGVPLTPELGPSADLLSRTELYRPLFLSSLDWIVGGAPGCTLEGMLVPLSRPVPADIQAQYAAAPLGHRNTEGLTPLGTRFVDAMMFNGMIVDTDHMSQHARVALFDQALAQDNYPLHAIHVTVRPYERNGEVPVELADAYGAVAESSRSQLELKRIADSGGTASPAFWSNMINPEAADLPSEVANDCDFSSKSVAIKYLLMMRWQGGRGLTPSTDMGFAGLYASRYGSRACHLRSSEGLEDWRRDWTSAKPYPGPGGGSIRDRCLTNMHPFHSDGFLGARSVRPLDPNCPSTQMLRAQEREFTGVYYDAYDVLPAARVNHALTSARTPTQVEVTARNPLPPTSERRDDDARLPEVDERVYTDSALQVRPLHKMTTNTVFPSGSARNTGWDFNLDGMIHIGMYPDLFQDLRNVGVSFEQMTPLFNAAEDYIRMWEKACRNANSRRVAGDLLPGCP